ncbi:hypothetical protein JKP88DRAFT_247628 [Tribonema minus]|uniref:Uncharacterized protein n=1 Tax=Tribonema minus TaxID=303371 RepID=A0A835YQG1_9STRA|nr:hypothetical protein JKP88DRAFT_247628 [Tribonema minus]
MQRPHKRPRLNDDAPRCIAALSLPPLACVTLEDAINSSYDNISSKSVHAQAGPLYIDCDNAMTLSSIDTSYTPLYFSNSNQATLMKKCVICHEDKPDSEYYAHHGCKYGVDSKCKKCKVVANRTRNQFKASLKPPKPVEEIPSHEVCSICDENKPLEEFYPHANCKYGVDSKCKECKLKADKEYHQFKASLRSQKPERSTTEQECSGCHLVKPVEEFYVSSALKFGYVLRCKVCAADVQREEKKTLHGFLRGLWNGSKSTDLIRKSRGHRATGEHTLTFEQVVAKWQKQNGRCTLTGMRMAHSAHSNC